jgi:peroxiredoxin
MRFILSLLFCLSLCLTAFAKYPDKTPAQNFTGTTLEGKPISLEELRGKVVVLVFWSTRCPICSSEIPKLNQMVQKYAGKNVVFLGLSMENESLISNYIKKKPFNFTLIPNSLGVIMQYAIKGKDGSFNISYPTFFVINQKGEIEMQASGRKSSSVDSQVNSLLSSG